MEINIQEKIKIINDKINYYNDCILNSKNILKNLTNYLDIDPIKILDINNLIKDHQNRINFLQGQIDLLTKNQ
jgi:hypothetical protein